MPLTMQKKMHLLDNKIRLLNQYPRGLFRRQKLESAIVKSYNIIKRISGSRKEEDQKAEEGKAKRLAPMRETGFAMTLTGKWSGLSGIRGHSGAIRGKRISVNTTVGRNEGPKEKFSPAWFYFFALRRWKWEMYWQKR